MKKIFSILVFSMVALMPMFVFADDIMNKLATPTPWTTQSIYNLLVKIGNFLLGSALAIAVIVLVYAGILYLSSGFNANAVKKAKDIFKYAVIGIAIVLAFGIIINTIALVVTGKFFGIELGSGGNDKKGGLEIKNPAGQEATGGYGQPCTNGTTCSDASGIGLRCSSRGSVTRCVRKTGEQEGGRCLWQIDCMEPFICMKDNSNLTCNSGDTCSCREVVMP